MRYTQKVFYTDKSIDDIADADNTVNFESTSSKPYTTEANAQSTVSTIVSIQLHVTDSDGWITKWY